MSKEKSGSIGLIILLVLIVLAAFNGVSTYNGIVTKQERVQSTYATIDAQLQRRAELIPNLVNTVKGYMDHETEVINAITESREKLINADTVKEKADASDALTEALGNFFVIVENYPDLKANTNFIQLQDELAGTENRIATARIDYNQAVEAYNSTIKRVPGRLIASWFGFEPAEYFEIKAGADAVPEVKF